MLILELFQIMEKMCNKNMDIWNRNYVFLKKSFYSLIDGLKHNNNNCRVNVKRIKL